MNRRSGDFLNDVGGQGLSVNAIILIVLGIAVLVVLILGFTIGWGNILPFVKTNNIQNIVTACETACTTGAQYDYCSTKRTVNDGTNKGFESTCVELSSNETYVGRDYGVQNCPQIVCSSA